MSSSRFFSLLSSSSGVNIFLLVNAAVWFAAKVESRTAGSLKPKLWIRDRVERRSDWVFRRVIRWSCRGEWEAFEERNESAFWKSSRTTDSSRTRT